MTEHFELDEITLNYLEQYMPKQKSNTIYAIFDTLLLINNIPNLDMIFDIEQVDDDIVEIITNNDELPPHEIIDKVNDYIKSAISSFLERLGITFDNDFTYRIALKLLEGYYTILTIGEDSSEEIIDLINSEAGPREILLNLLTTYTDLRYVDLLDLVDDVELEIIDILRERVKLLTFLNNPDIEEKAIIKLKKLIDKDNTFLYTYFYNYFINTSPVIYPLDSNLKILYSNLEKHNGNLNLVPYELFITLYLSEEEENLFELYKENIFIENVEWIGEDNTKHIVIENELKDIINKFKEIRI